MIMRIRLDQPFTLPQSIKGLIRKNLKFLYPYFHKRIIEPDGRIHNTLSLECIKHDENIRQLVHDIYEIIHNCPFEAFLIIHTNHPESISSKGLRIPANSIFKSRCINTLKLNGFPSDKLIEAKKLLSEYDEPIGIDFFMPFCEKYIDSDNCLSPYKTALSKIFNQSLPEALDYLSSDKNTYLVQCIVRFRSLNTKDQKLFIIEIIKYFTYKLMTDFDYPLALSSTTFSSLKSSYIINVSERTKVCYSHFRD